MNRIGVDFRFLAEPETTHRGMGRYTIEQLRAVLKCDSRNEYILFCHQTDDITRVPEEIRQQPNVRTEPIFRDYSSARFDFAGMLSRSEEIQRLLEPYGLSLFHLTTPMNFGVGTPLLGFDVCRLVATHYDLIPKLFPDHYLSDPVVRRLYFTYATQIHAADHLIAISQAVKREAVQYLDYPEDRIDVAYPTPAPIFRPQPPTEIEANLSRLWKRLHVSDPSRYIISLVDAHYSKNLETLIQAFGRLPATFRQQTPLVLVFKISNAERSSILELARRAGICDREIIFTNYVTDEELKTLYNGATVLVHPSRYEGFGLPVMEAMRCGTPVITTTAASLPEVGGDAAILVDPEQVNDFVEAIMRVCSDSSLQVMMRQRGLEHTATFTEENLGQATLTAYRQAISRTGEASISSTKLRLALWTPISPDQSISADHSTALLKSLSQQSDMEIFVRDNILPDQQILDHFVVHHHTAAERRQHQRPFDIFLYQVGSSSLHDYMYPYLETYPGILILHDVRMGFHIHQEMMRLPQGKDAWLGFLTSTEGSVFAQKYQQAQRLGNGAEFLNEELVLQAFIDNSLGIIVLFEEAQHLIHSRYPNALVYYVPPSEHANHSLSQTIGTDVNQFQSIIVDVIKRTKEQIPTRRAKMPKLPSPVIETPSANQPRDTDEALGFMQHYYEQFETFRLWEHRHSRYARYTELPLIGFLLRTAIRVRHLGHLFAALSGYMTSTLVAQKHLMSDLKSTDFITPAASHHPTSHNFNSAT